MESVYLLVSITTTTTTTTTITTTTTTTTTSLVSQDEINNDVYAVNHYNQ